MSDIIRFLQSRRSVVVRKQGQRPLSEGHLEEILACGLRVPDHGGLAPWRIVVIDGASGERLGREILAPQFLAAHPEATEAMLAAEAARLTRSPVVLAVLSCPREHPKIPVWEMELSAGAVCQNLLIAAQALDYAAQWLTEWYAYDDQLLAALGGTPGQDKIAGFIYIGEKQEQPDERRRPQKEDIVRYLAAG